MPKFRENRKVSKKCLNFMAYVREVVFHLPRVMIHNINSTDLGSYHIEGFQDWCMYSRNNHMLEIATWDEKPCRLKVLKKKYFMEFLGLVSGISIEIYISQRYEQLLG